jgi:hypothetical protein
MEVVNSSSNFDLIQKIQNSSVLHQEVINNLFMPVQQLNSRSLTYINFVKNGNKRIVKTEFGTIEHRNRILTEKHRDIIYKMIEVGRLEELSDGKIACYFDEIDILKALKMGETNYSQLRESVKVIIDANYYISIGDVSRNMRIIHDHILDAKSNKKMQGVIFSAEYVKMHRDDFSINHKSLNKQLSDITLPTIKSVIKYLMVTNTTTEAKTYGLVDVLQRIGFPLESDDTFRRLKSNLKGYQEELLENFNIIYNPSKKTLTYSKPDTIIVIDRLSSYQQELSDFIGRELTYKGTTHIIKSISEEKGKGWRITTNLDILSFDNFLDDFIHFLKMSTGDKVQRSLFQE